MKTQTFGISETVFDVEEERDCSLTDFLDYTTIDHFAPSDFADETIGGLDDWGEGSTMSNYFVRCMNGNDDDADRCDFPADGEWSWVEGKIARESYHLRYDEGPGDREWMRERDQNAMQRVARAVLTAARVFARVFVASIPADSKNPWQKLPVETYAEIFAHLDDEQLLTKIQIQNVVGYAVSTDTLAYEDTYEDFLTKTCCDTVSPLLTANPEQSSVDEGSEDNNTFNV